MEDAIVGLLWRLAESEWMRRANVAPFPQYCGSFPPEMRFVQVAPDRHIVGSGSWLLVWRTADAGRRMEKTMVTFVPTHGSDPISLKMPVHEGRAMGTGSNASPTSFAHVAGTGGTFLNFGARATTGV
ncbi:hypothetical protein [Roseovarius sp. THAF8]|uniref:hypothetical protein n=1 Tax=Roseovarius sp. THAF8 TaxID=2587846 RepID=UPI0015624A9C|nr:hypothetical protein [Roseovarius sp. THAF8]